jgi:hypothetical protein
LKKLERDGTVIETYFTPSTNPEEFRNGYYYTEEWDGSNTIIHKRDATSGGWVKGLDGDGVEVWNQNHGQANANLSGWVIMAPDGHAYYQATYNSNPDGSVRRIDIDNNNTSLPGVPYIFNIGNS